MQKRFFNELSLRLRQSLPAEKAHRLMLPEDRPTVFDNKNYRNSTVNIILFFVARRLHFVLTKRCGTMTHHSNQISLPGGKTEKFDKNLWETVRRETLEETNIRLDAQNRIGKLSMLSIPVSKFNVYPFVSYIDQEPQLPENNKEVSQFFKVDYINFFKPENKAVKEIVNNNKVIKIPYYKLSSEVVWGATAMILSEFNEIIKTLNTKLF